jgi:hypothetical protein
MAPAGHAEDLVMPFACSAAGGGEIRVMPSNELSYRIAGPRDEQPFVACRGGGTACETMMVHRFAIECDGEKVAWSRVANAAKVSGVSIPSGLPNGFAPVSSMSGRFVLPSLTRTEPVNTRVATQDLSPDSVVEARDEGPSSNGSAWVTVIEPNTGSISVRGGAQRIALSLASVLAMLVAASMVAAGRWRIPHLDVASVYASGRDLNTRMAHWVARAGNELQSVFARLAGAGHPFSGGALGDELANALSSVNARFLDAELSVALLASDMLLRDVLNSELQQIRSRLQDVDRQLQTRAPEKSAAIIRTLLRDLDRISRISRSAAREAQSVSGDDDSIPQSMAEAYRILGMNADAAPQVAKKLVDALRMSWHPDHARDEADRVRREGRMKQINAAWDMIKDRRAAA